MYFVSTKGRKQILHNLEQHNENENSFTIQYFTHPFLITSSQCFSTCREDLALWEYVDLLTR